MGPVGGRGFGGSSRIELALGIPEPGKNWNINETF